MLGLSLHQAASLLFPFVSLFYAHPSTSRPHPLLNIYLRARGPLVCIKSHHARSDLDANDTTSLHSFTFTPVILFAEYWRLDSYLDIVPQDRCSCPARTSASHNYHRTSTRLVVRVVEHPVYGRKLIDCFTSTTPVGQSPGRAAEHSGRIGSRRFLLPTDDPVWFLAPKSLQVFFSFLQSEVFAMRGAPFSCTCLVRRVEYFFETPISAYSQVNEYSTITLVPMQTSGHMQIVKIAHFLHIFPIVLAQKKYSR